MRHVENHSQTLDLLEQLASPRVETAAGVCAVGINSRPVMRRTDGAQALFVGALQVFDRHDGIRAFKTEDVADGQLISLRGSGPDSLGRARCLIALRRTEDSSPYPFIFPKLEMVL